MNEDFDRAIDADEGYRAGESFEPSVMCPTCDKETTFTEHECNDEDCGETWLTCDLCGAKTDDNELEAK